MTDCRQWDIRVFIALFPNSYIPKPRSRSRITNFTSAKDSQKPHRTSHPPLTLYSRRTAFPFLQGNTQMVEHRVTTPSTNPSSHSGPPSFPPSWQTPSSGPFLSAMPAHDPPIHRTRVSGVAGRKRPPSGLTDPRIKVWTDSSLILLARIGGVRPASQKVYLASRVRARFPVVVEV